MMLVPHTCSMWTIVIFVSAARRKKISNRIFKVWLSTKLMKASHESEWSVRDFNYCARINALAVLHGSPVGHIRPVWIKKKDKSHFPSFSLLCNLQVCIITFVQWFWLKIRTPWRLLDIVRFPSQRGGDVIQVC